jgi:hypothetical protein
MNDNYELANGDPDVWFEAQSDGRVRLIVERAMRKVDIDYIPDEDHYMAEIFEEAVQEEVKLCLISDIFAGMKEEGLIADSVDEESGELMYHLTDLGRYYAEEKLGLDDDDNGIE